MTVRLRLVNPVTSEQFEIEKPASSTVQDVLDEASDHLPSLCSEPGSGSPVAIYIGPDREARTLDPVMTLAELVDREVAHAVDLASPIPIHIVPDDTAARGPR